MATYLKRLWDKRLRERIATRKKEAPPFKAGEFSEVEPLIREWTTNPIKLARRGDVLVCVVGATAGKVNLAIDCAIGRSVAAVRPDPERLDAAYLHYFLRTRTDRLRSASQGLAQGVITREMLSKVEIPLPPLAEQRRIAAILDKADALRRKRRHTIELLENLCQSIFLEMFGDLESNDRGWPRLPFEGVVAIDAPLVDPKKPELRNLLHYGPDRIERNTGRLLPALTAEQDNLKSSKFLCDETHILYSKIRPYLNKVALSERECLCSADVYPVFVRPEVADRLYIWFLLRSNAFLNLAESCSNRANIPKINREQFLAYAAPIPPLSLQREFASRIDSVRRITERVVESKLATELLFSSLQQRAFYGQI